MTAVDYLSFSFNEFDLHQCWRNATKHKNSIINGRRLENASWRKFFQMKFALKTIDPATLNWQKDSDVIWLYGPFHAYEPLPVLQAAYMEDQCEHSDDCKCSTHRGLKPALKKNRPEDFLRNQDLREIYLRARALSDPDLFLKSLKAFRDSPDEARDTLPGRAPDVIPPSSQSSSPAVPTLASTSSTQILAPRTFQSSQPQHSAVRRVTLESAGNEHPQHHAKHIRFSEEVQQRLILETSSEDSTDRQPIRLDSPVTTPNEPKSPSAIMPQARFGFSDDDDSDETDTDDDDQQDVSVKALHSAASDEDEEDNQDTALARRIRGHELDLVAGDYRRIRVAHDDEADDMYAGAIFIRPTRSTSPAPSLGAMATVSLPSAFLKDPDEDSPVEQYRRTHPDLMRHTGSDTDDDPKLDGSLKKGLGSLSRSYSFDRNLNKHIELSTLRQDLNATAFSAFVAAPNSSGLRQSNDLQSSTAFPKWSESVGSEPRSEPARLPVPGGVIRDADPEDGEESMEYGVVDRVSDIFTNIVEVSRWMKGHVMRN
ncbi:hypothetical protein HK405_012785 [Cladochytrium tenue]|nr:hypothetical protein HK405_012785 [Cladochytrium tenue]